MTKRTNIALFLILLTIILSQLKFIPEPYHSISTIIPISVALILLIIEIVRNRLFFVIIETIRNRKS